jgi:membrane-bound lytic murein transglycosylase B
MLDQRHAAAHPSRRDCLALALSSAATLMASHPAFAKEASGSFDQWIAAFEAKALARGITAETYARVMTGLEPDTTGLDAIRSQPEFNEQLWQYLNRRVSDWRVMSGKQKAQQYASLLARIAHDYGVEPAIVLGVWGVESTFGDPLVQKKQGRGSRKCLWRRGLAPRPASMTMPGATTLPFSLC